MSFNIRKKDSAQPAASAQPKQAAEETKRFNIRKKEEPEGLSLPTLSDTVKKKAKGTAAAGRIRAAELPSAHIQDLKNRQQQAAADLDTEELDRINRELKGLRADAGKQTLGDRVSDVASAVLGGSASSFVNAAGMFGTTAHDPKNNPKQIARMQKALDTGRLDDGKPVTEAMRKTIQESIDRMRREMEEGIRLDAAGEFFQAADRMADTGARYQEQAKEGLGAAGSTIVDAATSMGQSTIDGIVGGVTGLGMAPFVVRAFGGAAQEARRTGADLNQQFIYGAAQAAKEYITEKLFGLAVPQRIMGSAGAGSFDDAIEKGIRNVTERLAKTPGGQKALGGVLTWLAGGATEGLEEGIGSVLENIFINPNLRLWDPDTRTGQQKFEDALYDMLVGGVSGLMGVTNLMNYQPGAVKPLSLPSLEDADMQRAPGAVQEPGQGVLREGETQVAAQGQAQQEGPQRPKEAAPGMGVAGKTRMAMADFVNSESPVWNNVEYGDADTQAAITQNVHKEMLEAGEVVRIPESTTQQTAEAYPDLRGMKKADRAPILREKMNQLKGSLRQLLNGLKGTGFEFEVNGNVLEARLYNTGIREVLEKVNQDKASMLYHSDEIFRNAKYLYSTPDYSGDPNIYRWNYFYSPVQIGDETVGVRIAVRDMKQTAHSEAESQIYNWGIKKDILLDGGGPGTKPLSTDVSLSTSSGITITQPEGKVNGENGGKTWNGGLNDGEGAGGTVPAEAGGRRAGGQGEADVFGGDRGRLSGQSAGGQAGELARGTGRTGGPSEQGRTAVERQNHAKDLRREKISSRELGLEAGTDAKSIISVPLDDWDDGMSSTAERIWDETGVETVYVLGGIEIVEQGGQVRRVRGVYESGKRIIIQADNLRCTIDQIADHEIFHDKAFQTPGLIREIEDKIALRYGREEFNRIVDTYIQRLRGIVDVAEDAGIEEIEAAYQAVLEEIYADAYAGINAFSTNAGQFSETVEETLADRGLGRRGRETGEATDRTTGPPSSRYSYGGRYASRADSESLAAAERLETQGMNAEYIRQETGWFRGMDGKWRFEIDDSGMEYSRWGDMNREDRAEYARFRELEGKFIDGSITEVEQTELRDLINQGHGPGRAEEQGLLKLSDFIHHEELFQNYPQLRKTGLRFAELPKDVRGTFDGQDIVLSESLRNAPEDTLVHEIQHAIQRAEGFARGATWEYWNRRLEEGYVPPQEKARAERVEAALQTIREIEATAPEGFLSKLREYQYLENYIASEKGVADMGAWERAEAVQTELEEQYGDFFKKWFDADWERQMAEGGRSEALPSDLYRNTAGEIEARDAAKRRRLPPEERRLTLPDLGNENTVFAEGDGKSLSFAGKEIPTYEELIKKPDIQIVDIRGERSGRFSDQRKNFLSSETAKKLCAAPVENRDTGESLFITPRTFTHTFSNMGADQIALAEHLPEVIREAVLTHGEQSRKAPDDMTTGVFTLLGAVRTETGVQPVKLKVKEYAVTEQRLPKSVREYLGTGLQPQTYASVYDGKVLVLEGIEKEDVSSSAPSTALDSSAAEKHPSTSSAISVKDLLGLVKGDAEKYVPRPGGEVRYSVDDSVEEAWANRPKTPLEAVQREIERLSSKEYQERTLREEGPKAIVENERTIRQLQKRAEKLMEKQGVNKESVKDPSSEGAEKRLSPQNKAMMEAIQKELDQRRSEEYKTELLHNGGVNAVVGNEREIKKLQTRLDKLAGRKKKKNITPKKPAAESKPIIAKRDLRKNLLGVFSIPEGQRAEVGTLVDSVADQLLREGALTEEIRNDLFDRLYSSGVVTEAADAYFQEGRNAVAGGRIFVNDIIKGDFGDDWNAFRKRALANGVYLTNDQSDAGVDVWNQELGETLPGLFNQDELDGRTILERIVQVAEEGRDQKVSLAEYTKQLAGEEYVSEREILDNMERQMDWALRTFAEKADLEIRLRDRTGVKIAQEREKFAESSRRQREREALRRGKEREQRRDMMRRQRENRELRELQQRTLRQLQWLNKNRHRAPEKLRSAWDQVLGDIDIYAAGAANEMNWSKKYEATWRNLAQMYQEAKENDPNFLPSKDLERIVQRLDGDKIADMDIGALQDLYKAAVGLRTEFYNRNQVIGDEEKRLFAEVYKAAKHELKETEGGYTGKGLDKYLNLEHLTPMSVFQRMGGWNPNGTLYSMAKQLEQGERAARAYTVEAKRQIEDFLKEHHDWIKRADGQGKDAIWYELEVPELMELGMGDKPIFGDTIKVYMTPSQKVHLYLESKSFDNLRHMTGGRTFVNRELYSRGKRTEALAQGVTVKLAPETVKKIVSDLTDEELALAKALEQYYNEFAAERINAVSNPLLGYDKAVSQNYAPIFTNRNFNRSEPGVFDVTAEGVPHMKGRIPYSKNPSYNLSAFDAFERHVDQTSRFVGYAIPVQNMNRLLNWQDTETSMKQAISDKWGGEAVEYINDLLTELQGPQSKKKSGVEALTDSALSNYISSVFGANPGIVFKQAMSFPLAGTYLGWENVPNIAAALRTDDKLINTYTSELAYRLMGYATPETAQLKNNPSALSENKFLKFTFGGGAITAMDGWTVKSMWRWAENAVRRETADLETGTQEQIDAGQSPFYKEVARRFEEAVSRSQPMYDVMHRPDIMRNRSGIARAATLFKTVPLQQYNMLRQTLAEAQRAKRIYRKDSQAYREAQKRAGRAVQGVVLATLGIEAVNFLVAMLKNAGKRYRDDDEELTWASVGKEFLSGFLKDSAGMIAGGDVAAEFIGSKLTGERWYGIETPGITQLQDILEELGDTGDAIWKLLRDGITLHKNGGDLKEYLRRHGANYLGALEEGLRTVAKYFGGIPADNIRGYALGVLRWISPETETAYQDWIKTADKDGLKGLKGEALETRIYDILKNRTGEAERETAKDLAALYAAGYKAAVPSDTPESVTVDGENRKLNVFQKQLYDNVWKGTVGGALDEVAASETFREADQETQAQMLRDLYSYAGELAKAEVFEDYSISAGAEKAKEILRSGLDMTEYLALNAAGGVDRYLKAAERGIETEDAAQAALAVSEIREEAKKTEKETEKKVPNLTLYREALRETRDMDAQMAALSLLMSEGEYARLETGVFRGITPELYVTARESIAEIDKNGSVSQDEAARAIGFMPGLTDEERAVLWQLQNKSWKPGKNPFSVKAGEKVYKDLQDGGGTLEQPEEELRGLELPRLE